MKKYQSSTSIVFLQVENYRLLFLQNKPSCLFWRNLNSKIQTSQRLWQLLGCSTNQKATGRSKSEVFPLKAISKVERSLLRQRNKKRIWCFQEASEFEVPGEQFFWVFWRCGFRETRCNEQNPSISCWLTFYTSNNVDQNTGRKNKAGGSMKFWVWKRIKVNTKGTLFSSHRTK